MHDHDHEHNNDNEQMEDENDIRIGVFVCDCGSNIAGVVDVPALVDFASGLDNVVFSEEGKWICAVDYLIKIKEHIGPFTIRRISTIFSHRSIAEII